MEKNTPSVGQGYCHTISIYMINSYVSLIHSFRGKLPGREHQWMIETVNSPSWKRTSSTSKYLGELHQVILFHDCWRRTCPDFPILRNQDLMRQGTPVNHSHNPEYETLFFFEIHSIWTMYQLIHPYWYTTTPQYSTNEKTIEQLKFGGYSMYQLANWILNNRS